MILELHSVVLINKVQESQIINAKVESGISTNNEIPDKNSQLNLSFFFDDDGSVKKLNMNKSQVRP